MPALVDTTIRLLGQEPLAGRVPTSELLRLAEVLDGAGFAYLEVSGGGVFDTAVRRGVESPWERIRALKARTRTPLAMALRGRFLVGARPVNGDFIRRFVASAAESGIDVFRLHDPLNDVSNLREASEAIRNAGREFDAGLVYSPSPTGETEEIVEQARALPELGAARVLLHDPSNSLAPHRVTELVAALRRETGLPVGIYCQGAAGNALAAAIEAIRAGADLVACAVLPLALGLHRVAGEAIAPALRGLGFECDVDVDVLWRASELVDEHIGDEPFTPLAPKIAVRAAQHALPAGVVAGVHESLRANGAADRLDEVLAELATIRREAGWPPLAAPIGQILGNQAVLHVLSASRYTVVLDELRELFLGRYGTPPGTVDATAKRAIELLGNGGPDEAPDLEQLRAEAEGLAASEEELLLLALFGDDAETLLRAVRNRVAGEETLVGGAVDQARAERIREIVRIVQESGVAEVTVEDEGLVVTVKRTEDAVPAGAPAVVVPLAADEPAAPPPPRPEGVVVVASPMVGVFYRAASPGAPPFVEVGDPVAPGQTLCILEAMKLMNEVKAETEAIVRAIHVENAAPVEYGQVLFELEPVRGRLLDAV
jgi:oxaloacetate decarboxylase (Na+ extruding) subunit alpha